MHQCLVFQGEQCQQSDTVPNRGKANQPEEGFSNACSICFNYEGEKQDLPASRFVSVLTLNKNKTSGSVLGFKNHPVLK